MSEVDETKCLLNLHKKKLIQHACRTCKKPYWVFRFPEEEATPIEKCCVCNHPEHVSPTYMGQMIARRR